MANQNPNTPNPTPNPTPNTTVQFELPKGMDKATFEKLFGTFNKQREYTQKRDKCTRLAFTALKDKHPNDYKALLNVELKKAGLPI